MNDNGIAPNAKRLLWAGFMAILAAGVGFSVRAGILGQWAEQFGFTMTELGTITGGGLTGFGLVIIITSLFADKIGYGKLMISAFILHLISAVLTLATPAFFASGGKDAAYWCLFLAMFIFAIGNGVCEAVVNPLVATLFPKGKTHYLNILHAGWPAGLVLGGLASAFMAASTDAAGRVVSPAVDWKIQMSLFLIPVILYGAMLLGQRFPRSEAASAGVTLGEMLGTVAAPLMIVLLFLHALVGYVELGTDSWISKITGSIMASPANGLKLFVYTSMLMFILRFFAGPIVHKISPLGLLAASAAVAAIGLLWLANAGTSAAMLFIAATFYGFGKTFFWPTTLGVVSEQYPRGGALMLNAIAGVGMISVGTLENPAIGAVLDSAQAAEIRQVDPALADRLIVVRPGLFGESEAVDPAQRALLARDLAASTARAQGTVPPEIPSEGGPTGRTEANITADKQGPALQRQNQLLADIDARTKQATLAKIAILPMIMLVCYIGLIAYFRSIGGYQQTVLLADPAGVPPRH